MINFTHAFDSAWERMMILLFRPFDLGKWFVIGFSAFLAGLLAGGNGSGFSYGNNTPFSPMHQQHETLGNEMNRAVSTVSAFQTGFVILVAAVIIIFALAGVVLVYWLGARGQFLFLDNIVRNRGAVADPWHRYARQANRVFFFYLLCLGTGLVLMGVLGIPAVLLALPSLTHHQWPAGALLGGLIGIGAAYLILALLFGCFVFVFREWGIPLIFRHDLTLRAALTETWGIMERWPGPTLLFILLRIALAIALLVVSLLACCFTCCLAALPYLGTVVLLPALIYVKCFTLDCLAQLGPQYDVWAVDVPPVPAPTLPPS